MLVTRTFKIIEYKGSNNSNHCFECPAQSICAKYVNSKTGDLNYNEWNKVSHFDKDELEIIVKQACYCRKNYPKCVLRETTPKEIHQSVRYGRVVAQSDSFWGLIGQETMIVLVGMVFLVIIALIICGIGSLFD